MRIPFLTRSGLPVTLRMARTGDAADLAAIHAKSFAHPWSVLTIEQMLTERNVIGHVAERRGIVGFILSRIAADEAEILSVAVEAGERGRGHAHRLIEENIRALARSKVARLFLEVEETNAPALKLYANTGFVKVGLRKGYYQGADGRSRDALMMRKDLDGVIPGVSALDG